MIGIYKLLFSDGSFYVGQSSCVERRLTMHKSSKGKGSPKLAEAWAQHTFLGHEILEEVNSVEELDAREKYWIDQLNPTLNTLPGGDSNRGLNSPRSKYSEEQILKVVEFYLTTKLPYKDIANLTKVGYSSVHDILKGRAHTWIWEQYPELKAKIEDEVKKCTFTFWDKHNNSYSTDNIHKLETDLELTPDTLRRLVYGGGSNKGWSLTKHEVYSITHDEFGTLEGTLPELKEALQTLDLSPYQIRRIINDNKPSAGWKFLPK